MRLAGLPRPRRRPAPCCPAAVEPAEPARLRIALVGNPNVGKSTLFNALTGARQHVGNWPGKTVQVASGSWTSPEGLVQVVDLPGTYSLVPRSPDEALVRDLLADPEARDRPDVAVVVLDAANLARNLYLLAQVLDTGIPVIVALGMRDIAAGRGVRVDAGRLSGRLGVPVVEVSPRTGDGMDRLSREVVTAARGQAPPPVDLGADVERAVAELADVVGARWPAVNLLTGDGVPERFAPLAARLDGRVRELRRQLAGGDDPDIVVADRRYGWVHEIVATTVERAETDRPTASDRVDRVLTSRWFGLPIFLLVMWGVFEATTRAAAPLQAALAALIGGPVRDGAGALLDSAGLGDTWVAGLVLDGLISGIGQLLTFVPLMAVMFVLLALLEDSGYMSRAAFVADGLLRLIGLPGHAFLPLIVGFGCNVPAIAGTRVLSDARHRLMTALLVPFVTCSARLAVYMLLANAFFGRDAGTVVFAMYVLSIVLVIVVGIGLRHTILRHLPRAALLLELPPYRWPTARVIITQSMQRLRGFLRTAGGVVVATVTVVWLFGAIPLSQGRFGEVDPAHSLYAGIARVVAPVFAPAGFADWHASGALITGFVAKEAVVSTYAQTYPSGQPGGLAAALRETFFQTSGGHASAAVLAFLVFLLAYTPCVATVAAQVAEIGRRWTLFGIGMQLTVAWLLATAVFQIGRLVT